MVKEEVEWAARMNEPFWLSCHARHREGKWSEFCQETQRAPRPLMVLDRGVLPILRYFYSE
jgi:hypothetical protein